MAKFRLQDKVVEATQWFKSGDHPEDDRETFNAGEGDFLGEGKVVRYYRHPNIDGKTVCGNCRSPKPASGTRSTFTMHEHGWLDFGEEGQTVCPGDWVITRENGEHYAVKPDIFKATCRPMNYITAAARRMEAEFVDVAPCGCPECEHFSNDAWLAGSYCDEGCRRRDHALLRESQRNAINLENINAIQDKHNRAIDDSIKQLRSVMFKAWEHSLSESFQLGFKTGKESNGENKT